MLASWRDQPYDCIESDEVHDVVDNYVLRMSLCREFQLENTHLVTIFCTNAHFIIFILLCTLYYLEMHMNKVNYRSCCIRILSLLT